MRWILRGEFSHWLAVAGSLCSSEEPGTVMGLVGIWAVGGGGYCPWPIYCVTIVNLGGVRWSFPRPTNRRPPTLVVWRCDLHEKSALDHSVYPPDIPHGLGDLSTSGFHSSSPIIPHGSCRQRGIGGQSSSLVGWRKKKKSRTWDMGDTRRVCPYVYNPRG